MKIIERNRVPKNKIGRIKLNNIHLEPHELKTINFLILYGFNIEVLKPSNTPSIKNADFYIKGIIWEAKSPNGSGNSTIARQFHKAGKQSDHMILDLRRVKLDSNKAKNEAFNRFNMSRRIKRLLLITKDEKLLDIAK